jgi:hypothetical protein
MQKIFRSIQRVIAEALFAGVLDEDYWMGIREGRIVGLRQDILRLENIQKGENKTNQKGLQVAIDALKALDNHPAGLDL